MKKYILTILALCLGFMGCDSNNSMCDKDADCLALCNAYDGNHIMYACTDGTCKCVPNEVMKCSEDTETDKCEEIC